MTFLGMDPQQVLAHADTLDRCARRLDDLLGALETTVRSVTWTGPDADSFRETWSATQARARQAGVDGLHARALLLQRESDEQESTSATLTGGAIVAGPAGPDLRDGLFAAPDRDGSTLPDVWAFLRGADPVVDVAPMADLSLPEHTRDATDLWAGFGEYGAELRENLVETRESLGGLLELGRDAVIDGRWTELAEVIGSGADVTGDLLTTGIHALTGWSPHLMDDGTGVASPPELFDGFGGENRMSAPGSVGDLIWNTTVTGRSPDPAISLSVVGDPAAPQAVIVNIPGTKTWSVSGGENPFDLGSNLSLISPQASSAASEAVAHAVDQLYAQHNIPGDTPMMLQGHSQGGMIATALAADEDFTGKYAVQDVLTYGSPVQTFEVIEGRQLNLQFQDDAIAHLDVDGPWLDLDGSWRKPEVTGNATTVTFDGGWQGGAIETHRDTHYLEVAAADPDVQRYAEQHFRSYFADGAEVRHFLSEIRREQ
ncbi:hypothetical protein JSY14_07155 [Brachybacterium sp. EF45031]|uniref:WXG100 family type VII secretion target n=1 Tax=Brachybacterium sillae TaxID=2810536 RepID=UPI00217EDEEA|nr:hypothetical protein [Brachybacterium sillae]MCS6711809.1 hypothetical protein [Brachybacterium sillae]